MTISEVLSLKQIGFLTPSIQISIICLLFVLTILQQYKEYKTTGKVWNGQFPLKTSSFFVGIYEEVIFRGIIFVGLMEIYSITCALVISSLLFGLWHLKNIFYMERKRLIGQILYAGLVFGPIAALITLYTGTIWLAVILHFCNNLFASKTLVWKFLFKKKE